MNNANYIREYYEAIKSGRKRAGRWIHRIYEILIAGLDSGKYKFDSRKANKAIKFIENFCHHSEGRSDLLKLELWQKAIISAIFGIVDDEGYRQFREVFIVVARKNGKTLFAAAIIAYMAYIDGEYGAKIYCLAPKLEQADLVYDAFYQITQSDTDLANPKFTLKRRNDIYIPSLNTSIRRLAFNSKKSDGFNPHLVVCDEIEAWTSAQGLRQYEVMKSALGARRQPLMLSICTAGYVDGGIYDELVRRSTSFLRGSGGSDAEERLLPFLYMIDDTEKWDSLEELEKSNPNLGVSVSEDFYKEEIKIAKGSLSKRAEFLAKYCNIKQNTSVAWLSYEDVDKVTQAKYSLSDFAGCYCVAGIDASQTTDLTAASVVIEKNDILYAITQLFMPRDRIKVAEDEEGVPYSIYVKKGWLTPSGDHFIDYKDIYDWMITLLRQYKIRPLMVGYDRYSIQYLIQDLNKAGFHTDDVYQGTNLSPILKELEGTIKEQRIEFGENQLLKSHLLNVAVQINSGDGRMKPVKINPRSHIDGFMSVVDALTVRSKYYSQYEKQLKNQHLEVKSTK
ncbi:MAG: terminase large subunit [Oscillospiraceae bacterium]|nr:terminase large subunit [Oscillospiraceae bacterium]